MSYSGKFKPKNPQKYKGDCTQICYRSSWELAVMAWCDVQANVISWSSEELVIPYLCPTDGAYHRYFVDFEIGLANGQILWIEIKPKKQTLPPQRPKKQNRRYITEVMSYVKNQAKWKAADEAAKKCGASFNVWTEDTLNNLGMKVLGVPCKKPTV